MGEDASSALLPPIPHPEKSHHGKEGYAYRPDQKEIIMPLVKMRLAQKHENRDKGRDENPPVFVRHGVSPFFSEVPGHAVFSAGSRITGCPDLFPCGARTVLEAIGDFREEQNFPFLRNPCVHPRFKMESRIWYTEYSMPKNLSRLFSVSNFQGRLFRGQKVIPPPAKNIGKSLLWEIEGIGDVH
jgi:hypothetical protein